MTARVAYLCGALERMEKTVSGTDDVPHPPALSQSSFKIRAGASFSAPAVVSAPG